MSLITILENLSTSLSSPSRTSVSSSTTTTTSRAKLPTTSHRSSSGGRIKYSPSPSSWFKNNNNHMGNGSAMFRTSVGCSAGKKRSNLDLTLKKIFLSTVVSSLAIAVYWNSLDGDFVHDDHMSILRNQDVRPSSSWSNLWWNDYWGMPMASQLSHKSYRPLTVFTYRANLALGNGNGSVIWFHATNMMIHAAVTLLLFFICLKNLRMSLTVSFTTSAMFALHPVHTEAVAGITGRADALACFFMLVSFHLYATSLVRRNHGPGMTWDVIISGIVGCCAMLAKETGITVLGINVLYDLYLHKDQVKRWLLLYSSKTEDEGQRRIRRRLAFNMTLISLSIGLRLALMEGTLPRFGRQDNPAAYEKSTLTRFLTYAFLPVFHFWLILCPYRLSYDWQMGSIPLVESLWDIRNLSTGIFYTGFSALFIRSMTKSKNVGPCVAVAMLFISLPFLPASNLFFPVGFVAAERILYTPSIGVCILTAHGLELLKRRFTRYPKFFVSLLCLMLMSFSLKTWNRNTVWRSRTTLFESGLRENPGNAKVHYNYANLQKDLGNIELAVKHYKIAISLWPDYASAHNNLGALSEDLSAAENCFLRAIQANPQHNGAHFNLGVIYMRRKKYDEALKHLEECLKIDPSHVEALQYLGACYNVLNKTHQVDNVFHKLITSDLPPSKLHTNFGIFLQEAGLPSEALSHYLLALTKTAEKEEITALIQGAKLASQLKFHHLFQELAEQSLTLKFDSGVAYMLAINYMEKGELAEAKLLLERLAEESNSFYKIHYAELLMRVRKWSEAEATLKGIPPSDPHHPSSLLLLAQLYENLNKTGEAFDILNCAVDYFCPHEANLCAQFYSQLGNLMHTTGAVQSAANYYDMAIKFNPNSVQAHTNIGAIYHLMSNYKQAYFHYGEALKIEPANQVILSNIKKLKRAELESTATEFHFASR